MVGLNNKTTQVHYSEFHTFCNHQVNITSYMFLSKKKNNRLKILKSKNSNQISIHNVLYIL